MVVCNSGPLIALGGIDRLGLLQDLFGVVRIPEEVATEWRQGGKESMGVDALLRATWIEIEALPHAPDPLLVSLLDLGEARAIEWRCVIVPASSSWMNRADDGSPGISMGCRSWVPAESSLKRNAPAFS